MARIRAVEIDNFRGIKKLMWLPSPGINCLIGPGDSGKSSILDAIDFCLGARRNIQFTDADFHRLDVETPITILVTIGELYDELKSLEAYGPYLRSFDAETGAIEDEPESDAETALTVRLTVASDLEPSWSLVSERAETQGQSRNLNWADRVRLAPSRIGVMAQYHLGWQRGSVLNRVSEERANASAALVKAARDARAAFGNDAQEQLGETLGIVATTAKELGISIGENVKALLDAHSVSFSGGTISLHDENGIPLRGLGVGSTRLLIAGLQRKAAAQATIILIDELEHGLEPHRLIRFLGSLGAKETDPPLQAFMTTHSPSRFGNYPEISCSL
jgi:putative ATP-dependent endonuclease of the OLD family